MRAGERPRVERREDYGWRQAWEAGTGNTVVCSLGVDVGCDILLFFDRKLDRVAPWRGGVWEKDLFVNIFGVR